MFEKKTMNLSPKSFYPSKLNSSLTSSDLQEVFFCRLMQFNRRFIAHEHHSSHYAI